MARLSERRQRFAVEYIVDLNATQAAIRAGYAVAGARTEGARLLANADVAEAVAEAQRELASRSAVNADRILAEYARIGFADVTEYVSLMTSDDVEAALRELPVGASRAISEVTVDTYVVGRGDSAREVRRVKIKLHQKLAALEALAKHLGLFAPERSDADAIPDTTPVREMTVRELRDGIKMLQGVSTPALIEGTGHVVEDEGDDNNAGH